MNPHMASGRRELLVVAALASAGAALVVGLANCASKSGHASAPPAQAYSSVEEIDLGSYARPVTTSSAGAQS